MIKRLELCNRAYVEHYPVGVRFLEEAWSLAHPELETGGRIHRIGTRVVVESRVRTLNTTTRRNTTQHNTAECSAISRHKKDHPMHVPPIMELTLDHPALLVIETIGGDIGNKKQHINTRLRTIRHLFTDLL